MPENTTTAAPAPTTAPQQGGQRNDRRGPGGPGGRGGQGGGRGPGGPRGRRPELAPEEKQFDERVIHIDRVARVVKGGRRFRFRALVVVGDRKNRVGVGTAKGADVTAAVTKATEIAKKHFVTVLTNDNGTVAHEAEAKVSGARILIMPASAGTGLIAGGVVRTVLEVAGVKNALSKSLGSTNKTNAAYATIAALTSITPRDEWVTTKHRATMKAEKTAKKAEPAEAPKAEKAEEAKPAVKKAAAKKSEA
ncbi:MAG TPA: 30S ribosomal protein S5 [Patescibacteria group bacterium]|nr:30S ribosomal protein S5 [Patescibacteria group bacterium]